MTGHRGLGRRHIAFEEITSTNALALDAARSGDPGPLWVTADRQLAGRGRRGRRWDSEAGNLYASLLLVDASPAVALPNLPLVIAVGLRAGLASLGARLETSLKIKWPNDILLGGAKCCGILIETERLSCGRQAVVAGVGVNVLHAPSHPTYPVTCLSDAGLSDPVSEIFEAVADGMENALSLWDQGRNFAAVRAEWLQHASGLGKPCRVNLPNCVLNGRFIDLAEDGRLILEQDDGLRVNIAAGDLFF